MVFLYGRSATTAGVSRKLCRDVHNLCLADPSIQAGIHHVKKICYNNGLQNFYFVI